MELHLVRLLADNFRYRWLSRVALVFDRLENIIGGYLKLSIDILKL